LHMAKAYCMLAQRLESKYVRGVDYGIVCWYHDEYTIECKEAIANDVKKISEECIRDAGAFFNISCPHAGEGAIGKNWFSIH